MMVTRTGATAAACLLLAAAGCTTAPQPSPQGPPVHSLMVPPAAPFTPAAVVGSEVMAEDPQTYVYLVNGADPFGWAGLAKVAERIRRNGYPRTTYGQVYDIWAFESEIRRVHAEDPAARFVLIGFSAGTVAVRMAANSLLREGVPVAMLGYIGGDYLGDTDYSRPAGVGRVVNVTGNGFLLSGRNLFWNGTDISGAANARLAGVNHFWLPMHPETVRMLFEGLREVSAGP